MSWEGPPAPYRVETERLVIRCLEPRDAALAKDAIDSSLELLQPWLDWALKDPMPLDEKVDLHRRYRASFDRAEVFIYGIFDLPENELLGGIGILPRVGPGGLEMGYWTRVSAMRRGYVTEATAALTRVGFEICEADRIEIHVAPSNEPSLGVPRKLGFTEEATLRRRTPGRDGGPLRDVSIFTLFREDFDPAIAPGLRAFDALGRQVI